MRIRIGYEAIRMRITYPHRDNLSASVGLKAVVGDVEVTCIIDP